MTARVVEVIGLVVWAWLAAVPVTRRYAAARWPRRAPGMALLGWQAIGLTGGLALVTAALTVVAFGRSGRWRDAVGGALTAPASYGPAQIVGLVLLAGVAGWLLVVLAWSFRAAAVARDRHRALLAVLARRASAPGGPVEVLDTEPAVSYALPRTALAGDGHVVLSRGVWDRLDDGGVAAVVAHEQAHLRQRHSLLIQPFVAWQASLPFLSAPGRARASVETLVEYVCDDAAAARCGPAALTEALTALLPEGAAREDRSGRAPWALPSAQHRLSGRMAVVVASIAIILGPPAVLLLLPW